VSPIQLLTDKATDLSSSIDRWNRAYLVLVFVTVVLAAFTFIAQFVAMAKGRKLAEIQGELLRLKDAELATDLSGKDIQIASLRQRAAVAETGISAAQADASSAQQKATEAKAEQQQVEIKLAEQQEKTAKAETARLHMQEALSPRWAGTNGVQLDELSLFSGTPIAITYADDPETRRLMSGIRGLLIMAKWNIIRDRSETQDAGSLIDTYAMMGGKVVNTFPQGGLYLPGIQIYAKPDGIMRPSSEAGRILSYILKDEHIGATTFGPPHWPEGLPDGAVWMVVGRKPQIFLDPEWDDDTKQVFVQDEERQATLSNEEKRDRAQIVAERRAALKPN
jgi:hypothetical protein